MNRIHKKIFDAMWSIAKQNLTLCSCMSDRMARASCSFAVGV